MNEPRIPELDAFTAERLLEGAHTGTPEALGPLTGVLDALRSPAHPHELAACNSVVSAMTAAASASAATTAAGPVLGRFSRRAAALALAGVVAAGGVAAAATGTIDSVLGGEDPVIVEEPIPSEDLLPVACDDAATHGEFVSSTAQSTESGPGKGAAVSAAAQSDCGKGEESTTTLPEEPTGTEGPVVEDAPLAEEAPLVEDEPIAGEEPDPCADAANHGEYVSGVAHDTPSGPGKGAAVSEAAQSDCGKPEQDEASIAEVPGGVEDDGEAGEDEGEDDGGKPDVTVPETPEPSIPENPGVGNGNGNGNAGGNGNGNAGGNGNGK